MKKELGPGRYVGLVMGLVIGAFALLWGYTASAPANFMPRAYGSWRAVINMVRSCDTSEVAILGASQASVAMMPHGMGLGSSVRNYSLLAATPVEAYYLARHLVACPSPPKVVVIAYSGYDLSGSEYFWKYAAQFGLFRLDEMQEIARAEVMLNDRQLYNSSFGSEPPPAMKNFLYLTHFPPYELGSLLASKGGNRAGQNAKLTAEVLASGGQHLLDNNPCVGWPAWEAFHADFQPRRLNVYYLERLISLLNAHHVKIIFLSPPMSEVTYGELKPRYVSGYQSYFADLQARHPEMKVVGPLFPHLDRCYFTDTFHVNARGAEAFSRLAGERVGAALGRQSIATQSPAKGSRAASSSLPE